MVNLVIFSILALALLITRRREGTTKVNGMFSFGLLGARVGRVGVVVFAFRKNRVYWRIGAAGGVRC